MSDFEFIYLTILLVSVFITMILYVLFGQLTIRKLRNNPETKHELGVEFVSGWDIINVAQALSIPRWVIRKFKDSPVSSLYADSDLLYRHTSKFDRLLAIVFYMLMMITGFSAILLVILDSTGMLDR